MFLLSFWRGAGCSAVPLSLHFRGLTQSQSYPSFASIIERNGVIENSTCGQEEPSCDRGVLSLRYDEKHPKVDGECWGLKRGNKGKTSAALMTCGKLGEV